MQTQIPNPFTPTGTDFNFTSKAPTPKKRQSMPRTSPASATGSDFDFDFTFRAPTSNPSQNYYDNRPISWSASARFPTAAPVAAPAAVPAAVPAASVPRRKTRQSYPRAIPVALEIPEPPQPGKKKQQKPRLKQEELHEYDEAALAAHNKSTMKPSSRIHEKAVMPTFIWAPPLISVPWLSPGHGVSWRRTVRRVGVRRVRVMSWIRGR
ncbi:uncharacterized protein K452DRAFT_287518 [Aplosporella prunicola CBS 121167]|uniref:Uncharacterized protein n=1 Tax=Aplosporella prunicola CBS 121167 TaxID=1176127 RepID=A0A6A6BDU3_9PEZI|nr:uncharacterized protein K452DRAFT_287518 [Aplosporella prunicola CBS 121167]KAF2141553.1 hypothetical protein K452DRAFT_287518 [Aplosporella prunicola CBS 121167]